MHVLDNKLLHLFLSKNDLLINKVINHIFFDEDTEFVMNINWITHHHVSNELFVIDGYKVSNYLTVISK